MSFWTATSNTILSELEERVTTVITLPIDPTFFPLSENEVKLSIISGTLPRGMTLQEEKIIGTPFEVELDTVYTFVIRANQFGIFEDRTFRIVVKGDDIPVWKTPEGLLPIGSNESYFIIDSAIIDFQLYAADDDISAGDVIEYYIQSGDGELPPGIQLTTDGRLVGIVEPILALEAAAASGNYDTNLYGSYPFDFGGNISDNGFDSYYYDTVVYDTFIPTKSPKKLNRYYQFFVTASDGENIVKRKFQIYVVGDDFLRADNTVMRIANGVFTADNTHVRTPIWLTPSDLGIRRANNYVTLFLDVLDLNTLIGIITYSLQEYNDDGSKSILPPGMTLDESNGEIAGRVPYQNAVTTEYKFTVRAKRILPNTSDFPFKDKTFTIKMLGEVDSTMTWITDSDLGKISTNYISTLSIQAKTSVPNSILIYNILEGSLPPGLRLSFDGEIIGKINSFGDSTNIGVTTFDLGTLTLDYNETTIDRAFNFKVKVRDHFGYSAIEKEFQIQIEDPDNKLYSNLYARPLMKKIYRERFLNIINDQQIFNLDYIYRPNDPKFGIQKNLQMLVYAGIETKDVNYFVTSYAKNMRRKNYILGNIKTAVAKNPGTNDIVYEVLYIEVTDPAEKENQITVEPIKKYNKITVDQSLYTLDPYSVENPKPLGIIIKTNASGEVKHFFDPDFKIQKRNGDFVIIDIKPLIINEKILPDNLIKGANEPYRLKPNPENTIKADYNGVTVDGKIKTQTFVSSIGHLRNNIKALGETEINFLPLWMRTAQENEIEFIGFTKAIPLCYCLPEKSKFIYTALNNAQINFNSFDFDIDRLIIDSTIGNSNEQYLVFHNYELNI